MDKPNFEVFEGVLYYEDPAIPGYWRIAVPNSLSLTLLKESHWESLLGISHSKRSSCGHSI